MGSNFEQWKQTMATKLENKEKLTEKEIIDLIDCEFDSEEGCKHRWFREMLSYIELNGKYYCTEWERGSTEMQESYYPHQPYEVEKKEYDKVIHVVEWIKK